MPYTDFHYTPTGTGVISGKEVLEQTEDAINDLGGQISGDVQTAIDTANNALNVANTASTDAQNAVNTANTAYTTATNAQNTANAAQNTASNALTAAQNAQNDVNALGNRVTTAENNITQNTTDISGLTTRMGTAEGNITTLQNDVITAQGTATSAQNTATLARGQAYVVRYASVAVSDNSTVPYTDLNNTDNIKANDLLLDINGKLYQISSVDTANETVSVTTPLTQLAVDSLVMHLSGNETANGEKTFNDLQIICYGTQYKGARNAYILPEFSAGYSGLSITTLGFAQAVKIGNFVLDANNKPSLDTSKGYIQFATGENNGVNACTLEARNSTSFLGTSANKWKSFNGVEPSSLSLPSGNANDVIDISSYLVYLDGTANTYTAPANGWISITMNSCSGIQAYINGLWGNQIVRPSVGAVRFLMPVVKNLTVNILIFGGTIDNARFIPCQGNV